MKKALHTALKLAATITVFIPNTLTMYVNAEEYSNEEKQTQVKIPEQTSDSTSYSHSSNSQIPSETIDTETTPFDATETGKLDEIPKGTITSSVTNATPSLKKQENQIVLAKNISFDVSTSTLTVHGGLFTQAINMDKSLVKKIVLEEGSSFPNDSSYLFANYTNLLSIEGLATVNTSNVTNMSYMFALDSLLTSLDVTAFDTSNVTDMSAMFSDLRSLTSLDLATFDTSNVINMSAMFAWMTSLTSLDLSHFHTINVTDMNSMFAGANNLVNLNISNFDTSHVITMSSMFEQLENLTQLDLSHFDTSHVTDMNSMFRHADSLSYLDLRSFNTSNVTNMSYMFAWNDLLTDLDLTSFDTSSVLEMNYMFAGLGHLMSLDLSNFNTSAVIDMSFMFNDSNMLKELVLGSQFKFVEISYDNINFYNAKLTQPTIDNEYTGKWINIGTGTATDPKGFTIWTADEFMKNYDGNKDSDTYVWEKQTGQPVKVEYVDKDGQELATSELLQGKIGAAYVTEPKQIQGYTLHSTPENALGQFTDVAQNVVYVYEKLNDKETGNGNSNNDNISGNDTTDTNENQKKDASVMHDTLDTVSKDTTNHKEKGVLTLDKQKKLPNTSSNHVENMFLLILGTVLLFVSGLLKYRLK